MILPRRPASAERIARHYDELYAIYLELWGEHLHHGLFDDGAEDPQAAAARLVSLVAELGGIRAGQRLCDIGCGYGATARELALGYGARVTGITLSEAQARHARERVPAGADLQFHCGDWLRNPFPDATFDAAIAVESLAHMSDPAAFFGEAARVLRPGGALVVCAWLASEEAGRLRRRILLEPICREGELAGLATECEVRALAASAGLRLERFRDLTSRVRRTWSVSARRLLGAIVRRPGYLKLLRDQDFRSRHFALAVFRIWAAYRVGAMRYGLFVLRNDGCAPSLR